MRAFIRKYDIELWWAFFTVCWVAMTVISYVRSGRIEGNFTLLFGVVGALVGALWPTMQAVRDLRIKNESLTDRVNALEHFVMSTPKPIDPLAKKTEEKLPS